MTKRIVFAGEVMGELRSNGAGFAVGFAGDSFNAAVYCQRSLAQGDADVAQVSYLTRIGQDPLSQGALDLAAQEGLKTDLITRDETRNLGLYAVQTNDEGERSFSYWRNQSAARALFSELQELSVLTQADILCLSGISLAILSPAQRTALLDRIEELRQTNGLRFAFDSNYRPSLWEDVETARDTMRRAWMLTDIALPSVDDEMALFEDADEAAVLHRLRSYGVDFGALKRADKGPKALSEGFEDSADYPAAEQVVDTTAAGDSFNGGFLAAHLQGRPLQDCMMAGHMMARTVVGHPGAIIAQQKDS
ncbi:sugar kinase [Epibacterium sp. SM1969]|uniref:Sugar kinase n=1 Tax=Tritonibacter aquimaris TaxID=2663379 RepID=A0A844ASY5_9RHOB|nr:sugar kinase [Tritonibacter aquimaris]MQY44233.1 sugar kinase [Tritonibacter aquimaris]